MPPTGLRRIEERDQLPFALCDLIHTTMPVTAAGVKPTTIASAVIVVESVTPSIRDINTAIARDAEVISAGRF